MLRCITRLPRRLQSSLTTTTTPLAPIPSAIKPAEPQILSANHPIVQRLFRPYIPADFEHAQGHADLKWLHEHAYQFGLDPVRDLELPALPADELVPSDQRYAASLRHAQEIRRRKQQRKLESELRQKRKMLATLWRKNKQDEAREMEDQIKRLKVEGVSALKEDGDGEEDADTEVKEYLPLRLRSEAEREAYAESKAKTVAELMAGMDQRVKEMRERKRALKKQRQAEKGIFSASGSKPYGS